MFVCSLFFFFFFSSRRRHTRLVSDWSSDVCSSDLAALLLVQQTVEQNDGGFHLIGGHFQTGGIDNRGNGLVATTCQTLALADRWLHGSIEEPAGDQLTGDPLLLDQVA